MKRLISRIARHPLAERGDAAHHLMAHADGPLRLQVALPDVDVGSANGRRLHLDDNGSRLGRQYLNLADLHPLARSLQHGCPAFFG